MTYTNIAIIYNPNSTGPSEKLAKDLEAQINSRLPGQKVECIATEHAGHAEELAYKLAKSSENPLIISSSGDGGYNEVVNGAMKAMDEGSSCTVGILPAGNANDHHRNLSNGEVIDQIAGDTSQKIDLLKMTAMSKGEQIDRYAHSYIGLGLTPIVGKELNKTKLNPFSEFFVVVKSFFTLKSIRLKIDQKVSKYQSLIFSNVDEMSKYLKISQPSSVTDGKFEVTIFKQRSKLKLIASLLKASTGKLEENSQVSEYTLKTVNKTLVQADGEIITLDANSDVTISIQQQILPCIV